MDQAESFALDAAKEITIAALQNGHCFQNDSGICTADYFEIVYKKILELYPKNAD